MLTVVVPVRPSDCTLGCTGTCIWVATCGLVSILGGRLAGLGLNSSMLFGWHVRLARVVCVRVANVNIWVGSSVLNVVVSDLRMNAEVPLWQLMFVWCSPVLLRLNLSGWVRRSLVLAIVVSCTAVFAPPGTRGA